MFVTHLVLRCVAFSDLNSGSHLIYLSKLSPNIVKPCYLDEVGWQPLGPVSVVEGQSGGEARSGNAQLNSGGNDLEKEQLFFRTIFSILLF